MDKWIQDELAKNRGETPRAIRHARMTGTPKRNTTAFVTAMAAAFVVMGASMAVFVLQQSRTADPCAGLEGAQADACRRRQSEVLILDSPAAARALCDQAADPVAREACLANLEIKSEPSNAAAVNGVDRCASIADPVEGLRCRVKAVVNTKDAVPTARLAPCSAAPDPPRCAELAANLMVRESVPKTESMCAAQPDLAMRAGCYRGAARGLGAADPGAAVVVCDLGEGAGVREACLAGLGRARAEAEGEAAASEWCDAMVPDDAAACRAGI